MAMVAVFIAFFAIIIQPVIDELLIQGGGKLARKSQFIRNLIMSSLNIGEKQLVLVLPQLLFVAFLGQAIFSFLSLYSMKTLGLKVVRNIRDKLYRNLIHQSIDFLSKAAPATWCRASPTTSRRSSWPWPRPWPSTSAKR